MVRISVYNPLGRILSLAMGVLLLSLSSSSLWGQRRFTVVIDAGHGGKDGGTVGNGGKEKDITLSIAKRVGQNIESDHPEVRVLYTRSSDVFVGLQARADFANKHKADLFLSIHVNSAPSSAVHGTETYVMGIPKMANNFSVAIRENKVMQLESNQAVYKGFNPTSTESYIMFETMQDAYFTKSIDFANKLQRQYARSGRYNRGVRQDVLWVLSQSAMPRVLTEVGFLSNKAEAAYMLSSSGQSELARSIAGGFSKFYTSYRGGAATKKVKASVEEESAESITQELDAQAEEKSEQTSSSKRKTKSERSKESAPEEQSERGVSYKLQFLTAPERLEANDARLRKLPGKVDIERHGAVYIYLLRGGNDLKAARRLKEKLPQIYKDAFLVKYQAGKRIGRV